jgi:hypothetical protein
MPPFAIERVMLNVRNKKGLVPHFSQAPHYAFHPTGYRDVVIFTGKDAILEAALAGQSIPIPWDVNSDWLIARFLLKMGLELMVLNNKIDPYQQQFDAARKFARAPDLNASWQYALGHYPRRNDLIFSQTVRNGEIFNDEQLYQYSAGIMSTGELGFNFLYRDHYFAINLNTPECDEYARQFNLMNEFQVRVITAKYQRR